MNSEAIRLLINKAVSDPTLLKRIIDNPESVRNELGQIVGANKIDDLLGSPVIRRAGCGDGPTCGVTCEHTCSGGYTMSCGGTCDYTCDYTAGKAIETIR